MLAHVNENCIGCGLCVGLCPEVFSMSDAGTAIGSPVAEEHRELAREAADSCPVDAIELR